MRRALAFLVLAGMLAAGGVMIALELSKGARTYGQVELADPCEPREPFPGDGLEASLQRVMLDGLDGAACSLDASREELVLSFVPEVAPKEIRWDDATIESAVRSGLEHSIDAAVARETIGEVRATILRELVRRAPIQWMIDGGASLAAVISTSPTPLEAEQLAADIKQALFDSIAAARERGSLGAVSGFALREIVELLPAELLVDIGLRIRDVIVESDQEIDQSTLIEAVRVALVGVIDDAEADGSLPGLAATVLREIVERAPIEGLIEAGSGLAGLLDNTS